MVALQSTPVTTSIDKQSMEAEMQRLLFRLEDGFEKIVRASAEGEDVERWEEIWVRLLGEYEHLYDQLSA